ncbi:MAG TPA: glutamate-cysteine ligase family protein [Candidatus Binataceae bacterium]|nr:glutamate-cysteine ligase family protein [Candidatus Binataceae bacterium]
MSDFVEKKEDLIRYFHSGAKPRAEWRVGSEYEKVAVSVEDGRALPFSGPNGVERILKFLADRHGYQPDDEEGRILALRNKGSSITIEPGGQIELSGEQCDTIHCAQHEFSGHVEQLMNACREVGATILGLGMQPVSRIDEIELLPKARYHIMYPYMARKGRLGQRMMKQTAGVQANLDYSDEADAMRKLRVSMGLVPLIYAIFSNSPLCDGGLNGYLSFRGHIWTDTDRDRSGIPEFSLREDSSFDDYAEYALDVPMYFLIRDHHYVDLTQPPGITFRQYMARGWGKERATLEDWANHLTTIFTEVRVKKYIEIRTADAQPPSLMLALPALLKGILYNDDCLQGAWDLVKRWTFPERLALADAAQKQGLAARAGKTSFRDLGGELMQIAVTGLRRARQLNKRGDDESIYLLRLMDMVRQGVSCGSLIVDRWKGPWNYDVKRLVQGCSYDSEALL